MPQQTSSPIRALGVLTGGGDVPGLNAAIKALTYRAETMNIRVLGLRAGWEGITYLDRSRKRDALIFRADDPETWQGSYLMPLNRLNTRTIDRQGGHALHENIPEQVAIIASKGACAFYDMTIGIAGSNLRKCNHLCRGGINSQK